MASLLGLGKGQVCWKMSFNISIQPAEPESSQKASSLACLSRRMGITGNPFLHLQIHAFTLSSVIDVEQNRHNDLISRLNCNSRMQTVRPSLCDGDRLAPEWRMDLFTTNSVRVTVCLHLDWRDRGPVFHLRGWMVRHRWSFQNLLHQNMQRLGGAEADGVFAGGGNVNTRLTPRRDLTLKIFLSLLIDQIVLPPDYPSTSPPIYQIKWVYLPLKLNQALICQTDKTTSHSNTYSTSCSVILFVLGLC